MHFDTNTLINTWHNVAPYLGMIAAVTGLSAFQQKIKNWFELEHPMVIQFLTVVFSFAAAVIPAALGFLSANPSVIGEHTAIVFTGMTLAYRYLVQPGSIKLTQFKSDIERYKSYKARQQATSDGVSTEPVSVAPAITTLASELPGHVPAAADDF